MADDTTTDRETCVLKFNRLLDFETGARDKDWQVDTVVIAGTRHRAETMQPVSAGHFTALALPVLGGGARRIHIGRGHRGGRTCLADFLVYLDNRGKA